MLQKENQWFVLHFGTNHIVHKNLTFYFLSRSIFIIVLGQKRGSKPVRFSSSPHHTSEGREDIFFLCSQNRARKKPGNRMVSGFFGAISFLVAQCGCGGRTRTYGLRVMSPTSCQLLHAAIFTYFPSMVPVTGLEPVRYRYRGILSPLCLPIPPHRRTSAIDRIPYTHPDVNSFLQTKIFSLAGIFQGGTA